MYPFVTAFFDALFPLSPHAKCVRDTEFPALAALCAPRTYGDVTALASYRALPVHAFIHEAKFHHSGRAIALLGKLLGEYVKKSRRADIHIVPIPLARERLRERGYNQALEIATAAHSCAPHIHIHDTLLHKIQNTPSQTSLSRTERLKNLDNVFVTSEHTLSHDTRLILFDDIVTTGATLAEAARTLKAAGFTHVHQLALAH